MTTGTRVTNHTGTHAGTIVSPDIRANWYVIRWDDGSLSAARRGWLSFA